MSAPRRLLDDPSVFGRDANLARELLSSGRDVGAPPSDMKAALWTSLEGAILLPPGGGGAGGGGGSSGAGHASSGSAASNAPAAASVNSGATASSTAATTAVASSAANVAVGKGLILAAKLGLATLIAGGAVTAGVVATRSVMPIAALTSEASAPLVATGPEGSETSFFLAPPRERAEALPEQSAPHLVSTSPRGDDPPSATQVTATATPAAAAHAEDDRATQLLRESGGVAKARTQLSQGNAGGALTTLQALDGDVPRGVLGEERALYAILALSANGQHEEAARRADAFLASHPNSPNAERVRSLAHH